MATEDIINTWAEAYTDLAVIFIQREEEIYVDRESNIGGFRGKEEFIVIDKVKESDAITSFYLKRKDGSFVPQFKSGQYIALTIDIPNTGHKHTRNYSLSDSNDKDYLRISVKKEEQNPDGIVSNYLHNNIFIGHTLKIGMPSGEFTFSKNNKPVVLIAGGVGITPLISMFKEAVNDNRQVIIIQCALNSKIHAFKNEIETLINSNTRSITLYSEPIDNDVFDYQGFLTQNILEELNINSESDFYFCGPTPFMSNVLSILNNLGVIRENINYEFFGPKEELSLVN